MITQRGVAGQLLEVFGIQIQRIEDAGHDIHVGDENLAGLVPHPPGPLTGANRNSASC